jgi:hypothetical protein
MAEGVWYRKGIHYRLNDSVCNLALDCTSVYHVCGTHTNRAHYNVLASLSFSLSTDIRHSKNQDDPLKAHRVFIVTTLVGTADSPVDVRTVHTTILETQSADRTAQTHPRKVRLNEPPGSPTSSNFCFEYGCKLASFPSQLSSKTILISSRNHVTRVDCNETCRLVHIQDRESDTLRTLQRRKPERQTRRHGCED